MENNNTKETISLEEKFLTALRAAGMPVNEEESKLILQIYNLVSTKENLTLQDIINLRK